MPTALTHAVIPLAFGAGLGKKLAPPRLLVMGAAAGILPDLDAIGFHTGVPYASVFGHRGFTHSLLFALAVALIGASARKGLRAGFGPAFLFLFLTAASHGLLDACTNGGLGVAFFWPFSDARHFFTAHRAILVAPLGLSRESLRRISAAFSSELGRVWVPCILGALTLACFRISVCALWRADARCTGPGTRAEEEGT
ncbi:MAG: metal-dependent hydrolase [Thermodesulfobacteriota bacterium]